ncbi:hypothetical protein MGWOODY_Tha2415 [hydrothermal vent metagenome]|uniref:DUF1289 domain-containing protein n=1 Tax=hydrothermal vent metagenome TaxID=652676 RepID=A0A160T9W1_9ZZZZ|nr:DUF1289 domain-containing protein [Thalassolituus oleivorans]APR67336.1 DUF1289 domain-containing protein [Thalassolituus oleivorans]
MSDPTDNTSQIGSPCVRNCCLDANDVCVGCGRSLAEILAWHNASVEDKTRILAESQRRKQALAKTRHS